MKLRAIFKGSFLFVFFPIALLHFPSASLVNKSIGKIERKNLFASNTNPDRTVSLYYQMNLASKGLSSDAFKKALIGYEKLKKQGVLKNNKLLTIVDFSKPSNEKRMFVLDLDAKKLLYNTWVAHGKNSGEKFAQKFSNKPESLQSSLGFYSTTDTYIGKHGYSLKLKGLEAGFNNYAEERAIVIHAADYVSEQFIHTKGFLGRSWGCPALPQKLNKPIIDCIKNGSCLFVYSSNANYLKSSRLLNEHTDRG